MTEYRYVLGLQSVASKDAGAALVRYVPGGGPADYVAISEERLTRRKYDYVFPVLSLAYCLDHFGLPDLSAVDLVVADIFRTDRWHLNSPTFNVGEFDYLKLKLALDPRKIRRINHHLAHAAGVYYTSGFDDAAILIVDGNGSDLETTSFFRADGDDIEKIDSWRGHGVGALYNVVTTHILNLGAGGEGKTMGLAPYGKDHPQILRIDGRFDGVKTDFSAFMRRQPFSDVVSVRDPSRRINPLRRPWRFCADKNDVLSPYFARVAWDVQEETERAMVHLGRALQERVPGRNVCLAGGVALNSVANKIMFDATDFERISVFPAASDAGVPFGLALWGYHNHGTAPGERRPRLPFKHAYSGRSYSAAAVRGLLERVGVPYRRVGPDDVAGMLADGKIVGRFCGGSEYGPRALGHRSILADSRRPEMRDIVNERVKHRETFRPFAPAVLLEHCADHFDIEGESPFMLLVAKVKEPDVAPATSHVDGTARVQTVTAENDQGFYDLIKAFHRRTGVPIILNTSFNDAGEPIVETPEDALICFLRTEMDCLVLEDWAVDAADVADRAGLADRLAAERDERIAAARADALRRLFPGCDADECAAFIEEGNRQAYWRTMTYAKHETERKTLDWVAQGTRLLLVGTPDHTALLPRRINGFIETTVVGFVDFNGGPEEDMPTDHPYPVLDKAAILQDDYDEIVVSSYQFMYDIADMLEKAGVKKPIFRIYDNSCRSLFETRHLQPDFPV